MFFEMIICVLILTKFDQNAANHDEKITETASA